MAGISYYGGFYRTYSLDRPKGTPIKIVECRACSGEATYVTDDGEVCEYHCECGEVTRTRHPDTW